MKPYPSLSDEFSFIYCELTIGHKLNAAHGISAAVSGRAFEMLSKPPISLRGRRSKVEVKGISGAWKARMAHEEGGKVSCQVTFPLPFERLPRKLNVLYAGINVWT